MRLLHLAGLALAATLAVSSADATTWRAFSHEENGSDEHSVWFSGGGNPVGAGTPKPNHFLFENASPGFGLFTVDGSKASLTGRVQNAAGDAFDLVMNFIKAADPGSYKTVSGASRADWEFYDIDDTKTNALTSVSGTLQSFDITLRGSPLLVQVGTGANDKDAGLFGLSTWITFTDQDAGCNKDCTYAGDINIVLGPDGNGVPNPVPLPAAGWMLIAGIGGLAAVGRRRRKA